jgi:hypothetical protein
VEADLTEWGGVAALVRRTNPSAIRKALMDLEERLYPGDARLGQDDLRTIDDIFGDLNMFVDNADVLVKRALLTPAGRRAHDRRRTALRHAATATAAALGLAFAHWAWLRHTHGLRAEYYEGVELGRQVTTRVDHTIDFEDFADDLPSGLGPEHFSVRWGGRIDAWRSGDYKLTVRSDDGARLWIDDRLVLSAWHERAAEDSSADVHLSAGWHSLRLEYFQSMGSGSCRLSWTTPGGVTEPVPMRALVPD